MTVSNWIRKNASTILTFLGAGGAITTVVLAVKATPKAIYKIQNAEIDKGEEILNADLEGKVKKNHYNIYEWPKLSVAETVQICWKDYIPTLAVGTASLACIFGANILSRKQQESMAAAYAALASAFEGYRDKVNVVCGPGIKRAISDIVCNGINMLLGEPTRGKGGNSIGAKVSYRQCYRDPDERRDYARPRAQAQYSYDDIIFDNRGDAEEVLYRMEELLDRFEVVSVADLFDMAGISCNYTDNKYGWTDLRSAHVERVRDGYIINLPRATSL